MKDLISKILKIGLVVILVGMFVGCNGNDSSNEKKEKAVIENYFKYLSEADFDKLDELLLDKSLNEDMRDIANQMKGTDEPEIIGAKYKKAADKFVKDTFKKLIKEYKIIDSIKEDNEYIITVEAKVIDIDDIFDNNDEVDRLVQEYIVENSNQLAEKFGDDEEAMEYYVFNDLAIDIFEILAKVVEQAEYVDEEIEFTVIEKNSSFLISDFN